MTLTFEQIHAYFVHRFPGQKIGTRNKISVKCCFHDDRTPSMTLFLDGAGGAHCNGCGAGGNIFQIEARISGCTVAAAETKVAEITGAKATVMSKLGPVIAAYDYRDDNDRVVFQKRRYQPEGERKTFRVFRQTEDGQWLSGIDAPDKEATRRVLYNQPRMVTANMVCICEGEKDCDTLAGAGLFHDRSQWRIAYTCSFDGAWQKSERPKWLSHYNPYFAGRSVLIFADNDEPGEVYAQHIAASVAPYALEIRIVRLPGLAQHGDVSDWMQTHTVAELEAFIRTAPKWRAIVIEREYRTMQDLVQFAAEAPSTVDWLLEGVIPRSGCGIIGGHPKASKSFAALDICIALSSGARWMGMGVPKRIKTALFAREDDPDLTRRRTKKLLAGRNEYLDTEGWCLVNTRTHQADFKITNPQHADEMIEQLGRFGCELVVFDVFRTIHDAEENDNTEMAKVLTAMTRIQTELRCGVAIVHHIAKADSVNIFKGLRGASAIHGWMEWGIGISVVNPEEEEKANFIRRAEFECKEASSSAVYYRIAESPDHAAVKLQQESDRHNAYIKPAATQIRERRDLM